MQIRPYCSAQDFAVLRQWVSDARTHALWCANRFPYPPEQRSFDAFLQEEAEKYGNRAYIAEAGDGTAAGFFCLSPIADTDTVMLKFVIVDSRLRGQGIGREMLRLAVQYAFSEMHAEAVRLAVFSVNTAAKRCYLHAGFTELETTPQAFRYQNEAWDRCSMILRKKPKMQYFITEYERVLTCYHEWAKGKFDGVSFWEPDSLLIDDSTHYRLHLEELFRSVIPEYDVFGEIPVTKAQWDAIMEKAREAGGEVLACMQEAESWVAETFAEYDVFTMIGV